MSICINPKQDIVPSIQLAFDLVNVKYIRNKIKVEGKEAVQLTRMYIYIDVYIVTNVMYFVSSWNKIVIESRSEWVNSIIFDL